jgi:hypothetical protein
MWSDGRAAEDVATAIRRWREHQASDTTPIEVLGSDLQSVVLRLVRDVVSTIGVADEGEFIAFVRGRGQQLLDMKNARTVAALTQQLVDEIQQQIHDEFIDVSWPRCPRHPNHPMWLQDGSWWCTRHNVPIAALGTLASGKEE